MTTLEGRPELIQAMTEGYPSDSDVDVDVDAVALASFCFRFISFQPYQTDSHGPSSS